MTLSFLVTRLHSQRARALKKTMAMEPRFQEEWRHNRKKSIELFWRHVKEVYSRNIGNKNNKLFLVYITAVFFDYRLNFPNKLAHLRQTNCSIQTRRIFHFMCTGACLSVEKCQKVSKKSSNQKGECWLFLWPEPRLVCKWCITTSMPDVSLT